MEQLATDFLSQQSGAAAAWIGGVSAAIFIIVKIRKAVSAVWPFVKKLVTVVEDLFGAEARPGVPARPGLMARMQTSEENDVRITAVLDAHSETLKELQPNHGGSMKDVLNAALAELREQGARTDRLEESLTAHIDAQRTAVVNAEASVVVAEAAASGARDAVVGAQEAVVGARAAVVGAREAVAAAKDRDAARVSVTVAT